MAQLIARAVWDREVEGLSPFTPTKVKRLALASLFTLVQDQWFKPSTRICFSKDAGSKVWRSKKRKRKLAFDPFRAEERSDVLSPVVNNDIPHYAPAIHNYLYAAATRTNRRNSDNYTL